MCRWEFCDILRSLCLMFDAISTYTLPATLAQIYPIVHCTGAISASFFNINSDINIYTLPQHKYQCQYLHPSCSQIYPIVVSCTYVQYVGWVVPVKCDLHNLRYNATFTIGKSVARMFSSGLKHRKNCECCPVTIDWQVTKIVMNPGSKRLIKANNQLHPWQIQFLDHIVVPVYRTLADLHPAAEEPYQVPPHSWLLLILNVGPVYRQSIEPHLAAD